MKKIFFLILILPSLVLFNSCDEETKRDELFNYVAFGSSIYSTGVDVGGTATVDVEVLTSNVSSTDRSYSVVIDPSSNAGTGSYEVPSSVNVPAGTQLGKLTITLSDVNLGIGINSLVINFADQDGLFRGDATTIEYTQNCSEVTATLDFSFDYWSSETGWSVQDALGGTVASGGGYGDGIGSATESIVLCVGRDYTLIVTDAFGDGMNDGTNVGSYTLTIGGVVKVTGGGSFGDEESTAFDTN